MTQIPPADAIAVRAVDPAGPDAARVVAVSRLADAMAAWGAEDFRRDARGEPRHGLLLAVQGDRDLAAAELARIEAWDEPHGLWLCFWVIPGREEDAGDVLWAGILEHCGRHGVTALRTSVTTDRPGTLAFLTEAGFREVERQQRVILAMEARPEAPPPPDGVLLTNLARDPGLLDQIQELDAETIPDIPGEEGVQVQIPDRSWWDEHLGNGVFDPRTVVIAVAGGRAVSYTVLRHYSGRPDAADVEYTATARDWRGRGLAALVKRACHTAAWDAGVREIRAWNDLANAPMRAVNTRLGYVRGPDVLQLRAEVRQPPRAPSMRPVSGGRGAS